MSDAPEKPIINLAFYRFVELDELDALRDDIYAAALELGLRGTVLLAEEGINGMLAGPPEVADGFADWLTQKAPFADLGFKRSRSNDVPFGKLVVKIKPEIVTMRVDGVDAVSKTAPHLPPEQFREWLRENEDMVVIDTRNDYEYELGTFRGAINPDTDAFKEFPDFVRQQRDELAEKKVVMFCTGGIRCEKATSWMLDEGFDEVYQLEGGILNYFEKVEDADQDWDGECFVFDGRVAVNTRMEETQTELCPECGAPVCGCDSGGAESQGLGTGD
jgi:UPF0176 protein